MEFILIIHYDDTSLKRMQKRKSLLFISVQLSHLVPTMWCPSQPNYNYDPQTIYTYFRQAEFPVHFFNCKVIPYEASSDRGNAYRVNVADSDGMILFSGMSIDEEEWTKGSGWPARTNRQQQDRFTKFVRESVNKVIRISITFRLVQYFNWFPYWPLKFEGEIS